MSAGILTGCTAPHGESPLGTEGLAPGTIQQVGNLETRSPNPSPATDGLADPRANHFVWFPHLERKKKEIKSDLPPRDSGWFLFCFFAKSN